jgi:RNA polymerase sigma factor (sigma-70 family)
VSRLADAEGLLRELAPQVLGALVRRYGDFGTAEDAVQEALLAAAVQWPVDGIPESPRGWLITVAARRLIDWRRREASRRQREAAAVDQVPVDELWVLGPDSVDDTAERDDSLSILFLCCHPALSHTSQVALTLRAVGGLTTAEIAGALLVPEATMAQRIVRAKAKIRSAGLPFRMPTDAERGPRIAAIAEVLYLIFNEGYTASSGPELLRTALTGEAIRLARQLHRLLPDEGEVSGLLALMLLTEARRGGRTDEAGALIPLAEQDRARWDQRLIREGVELISVALAASHVGPYQLQAAIAAVHAEAERAEDTDWPQIAALYEMLSALAPSPVVTLNHAVAVAMVEGPHAGLRLLDGLDGDPRLGASHRLAAVRAHLLELAGETAPALKLYERAARTTLSVPERHYLESRAARLRRARDS